MPDTRTYKDRSKYMMMAVAKRRRKVKLMAVESLGGKCTICGYNKYIGALELHHAIGVKDFSVGEKGYTRSWEKIRLEIKKCVLLCANCHREVGAGITKLP
jgi:5-methylcytosine-specific restriction endonuclease McrA